ncbi:MAG: YfhO family protein, partial [Limisphaerales bacterium]
EAPDDVHFTPVKRIPFLTGSVRMLRFSPTCLELESDTMERRPLVVAQNHYPCWRATVNGETEPVAKANHAFQAIMVPSGKSTIRLDYVDWPFRIGVCVSLATLLGCVVLWRRPRLH